MNEEVLLAVISITLLILTLSVVVVFAIINYNRKQEKFLLEKKMMQREFESQLMHAQIEVQEHTLASLGEELHDNIGQLLSSAKLLLAITQKNLNEIPDTFLTAKETLNKAIHDLRLLSKSFNKEWLSQFNLIENLKTEVQRINATHSIQAKLEYSNPGLPVKPESQIILFRIIQEALQNCIKHSEAKTIHIDVTSDASRVKVIVEDSGKGFDPASLTTSGIGIMNMKHRALLLRGTIGWNTKPGHGTVITILLPAQPKQ